MPFEISENELLEELGVFSVEVSDKDALSKLVELCMVYRHSAEDMASAWVAFYNTKQCDSEPTLDSLNQFEREELNKALKTPQSKAKSIKTHRNSSTNDSLSADMTEDVLDSYGTPTQGNKRQRTPTNNFQRHSRHHQSPAPFSPSTKSPLRSTPSVKYVSRKNAGEVVCTFGSSDSIDWKKTNSSSCSIEFYNSSSPLKEKYYYMFEKLRDRADILNDVIEDMAAILQEQHKIEELSNLRSPGPEEVSVVGRICCDSNGKINASSLLLEGSRETSLGQTVQLDVLDLKQYSFFPGQVIAARGINNQGEKLVLKHLYEGKMLPFPVEAPTLTEPLQMIVAAGPFAVSDTLSYEPLEDLLKYLLANKPHICILIGPFVDIKHEEIEKCNMPETFEDMFQAQIEMISQSLSEINIKVVLIPSLRDAHHEYIFPTPPFIFKDKSKLKTDIFFAPDPCILNINGVVIAITSTDILFHLGKEEINFPPGSSDRLGRLSSHILTQHSFYPLYPPSEDVVIDYEYWEMHAKLPVTPHVFILPSDLKCFIKDINGCCCINPEHLTRCLIGGSFARIQISPIDEASYKGSLISHLKAEVVKI